MNKKVPHNAQIDKVSGRTFHLPLPIDETLKKKCPDTDPINVDHELYILVKSHPSKSKMIWQDYVDIKKVWDALIWLKENISINKDIVIPSSSDKLLDKLNNELEYLCNDKKTIKNKISEEKN